ncbi:MAG: hypothetical protein IJD00_06675 [Clostridia bacterium]|nr:hypothetical protein [Clostridia bacterium]
MDKLHLYVAETEHPPETESKIVIKDEITQEELTQLNAAFKVCSLYHSITQIKDIVVENGESFKKFMHAQNLQNIRRLKVSPERAVTLANKAILNYASSIKTYIDMEKRLLTKHATPNDVKQFQDMQRTFYDENMEYRFWANFRNYIVHCEFPYSIYQESVENGCKIICTKEHLLKFDNWKHSKSDIQRMEEQIDLPSLVDDMSAMIYAFYIDFFSHFAKDIIDGIETYGEFCRKYDVRVPVIFKMKNREQVAGSHFQPLPIKELNASFDILRSNPHIKIDIK